ncbi:MAG: NusG domain II-containing protein [Clostridia bacterium]|nr:NusG domain II-containing protein [Clostridia bacterium]
MSLNKLRQIRADKWFRPADLIVYALITALIVLLFFVFVFNKGGDALSEKSVSIYLKDKVIFTYSYSEGAYKISSPDNIQIVEETETELKLIVYSDAAKQDFNSVTFNKVEMWVDVTEANCSARKDCVHMERIKDSSGAIMCTPHGLKILASDYKVNYSPDIPLG